MDPSPSSAYFGSKLNSYRAFKMGADAKPQVLKKPLTGAASLGVENGSKGIAESETRPKRLERAREMLARIDRFFRELDRRRTPP